jgi:alcohol dehydrogenase, propanol-preferring
MTANLENFAMELDAGTHRLQPRTRAVRRPEPHQVLLRVAACGVCRTDLHIVDGDLPPHHTPLVPGHEIVGTVLECGAAVRGLQVGERVGVPWLGSTCGTCRYCCAGLENLCSAARFTGYDFDGGYAQYALADARFCLRLPEALDAVHAAPLLCAGLIGYRALRAAGDPRRLGLYGFGAAAHLIAQLARHEGRDVYAFTRPGDLAAQQFALTRGACWSGDSNTPPPEPLDAAVIFAPVGSLVPTALRAVIAGGTVVCAGIHMSDIPGFPYRDLWGERVLRSVANLTRRDGEEFMALAGRVALHTDIHCFPLADANSALQQLRDGEFVGAAVLTNCP